MFLSKVYLVGIYLKFQLLQTVVTRRIEPPLSEILFFNADRNSQLPRHMQTSDAYNDKIATLASYMGIGVEHVKPIREYCHLGFKYLSYDVAVGHNYYIKFEAYMNAYI